MTGPFFGRLPPAARSTPKLRIITKLLTLLLCLTLPACEKLGLGRDGDPTGPSGPPAAGTAVRYTAVGASDANGVGSSVPCFPFTDCPDGKGYVPVAARQLRGMGYQVTLLNLGVAGAVISRASRRWATGPHHSGNLHEAELPFVQRDATVVTIFAGGNDVNVILAAAAGAGGADTNGYVDQQVRLFGDDYQALVDGIREPRPRRKSSRSTCRTSAPCRIWRAPLRPSVAPRSAPPWA